MVTNSEKIQYDNLKFKYEKLKAKFDTLEQENNEYKKENNLLKKDITTLEDTNKKLADIAENQQTKLFNEIAKLNEEAIAFNAKKKEYENTIKILKGTVSSLEKVVIELKSQKMKNSTNSSKPSSTNGYEKIIQNNRVKSGKSKGGQKGRIGKTLNKIDKVDEIVDVYGKKTCECGGEIEYKEFEYIEKQLIDLANEIKTIGYRFHKGVCKKCGKEYIENIPVELANPIQYSKKIKSIVPIVKNISNMSVETTKDVFCTVFNGLPISTGWIHKQEQKLAKACEPVIEKMKNYLSLVQIAHADETGARIDDKLGTCISFSDEKVVVYDMFSNKSKDSFDEFGIFEKYSGILVHDHNKTYYKYLAMEHAECNVHITRYLEQVIQISNRSGAKKLKEFLLSIYKEKLEIITEGKNCLPIERLDQIEKEYLQIIDEWEKEYNKGIKKYKKLPQPYKDEKNLFSRLREYKEEHLRFITDFRVPFSNNEAERNLRKIKMKLNTSKRFGKLQCAKNFAILKSIIETAKKQGKDLLTIFLKILDGDSNVFDLTLKHAEN